MLLMFSHSSMIADIPIHLLPPVEFCVPLNLLKGNDLCYTDLEHPHFSHAPHFAVTNQELKEEE